MPAKQTNQATERLASPPNDMIGKYRILGEAGSGGMAKVWQVKGPTGRVCALKEMRPQAEARREMTRRFKQEFEVTSRIEHRNVVRVEDFFAEQGTFHIVMEWVDGLDLRGVQRHGGLLDAGRLAAIGAEIASGMAAAHAVGVLHRDLKPENVLMDSRGRIKVADFGVARVTGTRLTATGIIVGSPAYMSPEQLAGVSGQKLTPASDVYALGVILYELGEGRDPLGLKKHQDLLTVLRAKREKAPRRFKRLDDEPLRELILACLEVEEIDRPQTMEAVARELRRIARRYKTLRADLEHLIGFARHNAAEGLKAGLVVAPSRPPEPAPAAEPPAERRPRRTRAREPRVPPREPRVPARTPAASARVELTAPPSIAPLGPARAPSVVESWDGVDPAHDSVEDYGTPERHTSRIVHLSVKRYGRPREAVGLLAWLALIALGAAVLFFGASASLTGSPLGLVEQLVPMP